MSDEQQWQFRSRIRHQPFAQSFDSRSNTGALRVQLLTLGVNITTLCRILFALTLDLLDRLFPLLFEIGKFFFSFCQFLCGHITLNSQLINLLRIRRGGLLLFYARNYSLQVALQRINNRNPQQCLDGVFHLLTGFFYGELGDFLAIKEEEVGKPAWHQAFDIERPVLR